MRLLWIFAVIACAAPAAADIAFPQKPGHRPALVVPPEKTGLASDAPLVGAVHPAQGAAPLQAPDGQADYGFSGAAPAASDLLRQTQKTRRN